MTADAASRAELAEARRRLAELESLVENNPVAVIVLDAEERVTDWNPAAAALFGYSAEEALGREIDRLVLGDTGGAEGREITREAVATGRAQRITRRRRKDGTPVDVELMLAPLHVEGAHVGFLAIYHDITDLQRARQHAETLLTVTQVLGKTLSLRDTIEGILGELQRVVPYDSCSVQVIQGNRLIIVGGAGSRISRGCSARGSTWTTRRTSTARSCSRSEPRSSPTSPTIRTSRATSAGVRGSAAGSAGR